MEATVADWERRLVDEALMDLAEDASVPAITSRAPGLRKAYRRCAQITAQNSRTFYFASKLLPSPKRQAIGALYAFCRSTDDIVDRATGDPIRALEAWRRRALCDEPPERDLVVAAWADTRRRHHIPTAYAERLVRGVAQDLTKTRYADFGELVEYCYGVASTVGLMAMHVIGFDTPAAVPYAVKLGVALQLTNILRDVAEDWDRDRLYLPGNELAAFGLTEAHVRNGGVDERWRAFLRFQIDRNRRLYAEAWPGIALLHRDGQFAVAAAADLYAGILDDIERHNYDVFSRRARVTKWGKLRRLPGTWQRLRRLPSDPQAALDTSAWGP